MKADWNYYKEQCPMGGENQDEADETQRRKFMELPMNRVRQII